MVTALEDINKESISNMKLGETLSATSDNRLACRSKQSLVTYVRTYYPRKDGGDYTTHVEQDGQRFTLTIECINK